MALKYHVDWHDFIFLVFISWKWHSCGRKKTFWSLYTSFTIHYKRTLLVPYSWCFQKKKHHLALTFFLLPTKSWPTKLKKKKHLSLRCADWNLASSSTSLPIVVRDVRYPKAPNCSLQNPVRSRLVLGDPQQFAGSVHRAGGSFGDSCWQKNDFSVS